MSNVMLKWRLRNTSSEQRSVFTGNGVQPQALTAAENITMTKDEVNSTHPMWAHPNGCIFFSSRNTSELYINGPTGNSMHRYYLLTQYRTENVNQAGLFCTRGEDCAPGGQLSDRDSGIFGDAACSPFEDSGYVELFVR
jgi:hypothetical protein